MAWLSGRWVALLVFAHTLLPADGFQSAILLGRQLHASPHSSLRRSVPEAKEAEIVAWSQTVAPEGTQLLITDIDDDIPLAAMFWNVVADLKGTALFAFPLASFSLTAFAEMVQDLDFGIQLTELADAPCPAMLCEYHTTGVYTNPALEPSAMKRWVQDVIVDSRVCPYTKTADLAGIGVAGVNPGAIGYPVCRVVGSDTAAMCAVIASFWNNCLDLLNTPSDDLSTILLCAPGVVPDSHEQFVRVSDAIVKTMQLAGANRYVSLVFFHPMYDRELVLSLIHI